MSFLRCHTLEKQSHHTWGNLLEDEAFRCLHPLEARGPYHFQRGTTRGSGRTSNLKHIVLCTDVAKVEARDVIYAAFYLSIFKLL